MTDQTKEILAKIILAVLTIAGASAGAYLSGISLVESTKISAKLSASKQCIDSVDLNEKEFRSLSGAFLSSVTNFESDYDLLGNPSSTQLRDPAKNVATSASHLSTHSPEQMSTITMQILDSVKILAKGKSSYGSSSAERQLSIDIIKWHDAYNEHVKTYDKKRADCELNN